MSTKDDSQVVVGNAIGSFAVAIGCEFVRRQRTRNERAGTEVFRWAVHSVRGDNRQRGKARTLSPTSFDTLSRTSFDNQGL